MTKMLNEVKLIGKMARDGQLRKTQKGYNMAMFSVCIERMGYNKPYFDYVPCLAWGDNAVIVGGLKEGDVVALFGHIISGSYPDKDGNKKNKVEVVVDNFDSDNMAMSLSSKSTFDSLQEGKPNSEEIPF